MRAPCVLLPGFMGDLRAFGRHPLWMSQDRPVMVAPLVEGERIEEMASRLLDVLPARSALLGQGLGGMVALEVMRRAPDRVTHLALVATTSLTEPPQVAAKRDPLIIRARTPRFEEILRDDVFDAWLAPGPERLARMELLVEMARDLGPEVFARQSRALQRRKDQTPTLRKLSVPTLVLYGSEDRVFIAKRHAAMAELIPTAQVVEIPGAGHAPLIEAEEAAEAALRAWLAA